MSNVFGAIGRAQAVMGGCLVLAMGLAGCSNAPVTQWPWVLSPNLVPNNQSVPNAPPVPSYRPPTVQAPNPYYPPNNNATPPRVNQPTPTPPNNTYQPPVTGRGDYLNYPALRTFMAKMNREHGFGMGFLEQTLGSVQRDQEVLVKVGAPAEGQVWRAYSTIFLTEERIRGGVEFWNQYQALLDAAARQYGVAPEYIVAIIGVETQYGKNTGKHNVLRALTTLSFDYPKRASFYQRELEQYLLLIREEQIAPFALNGSYAGAMGLGQFISSSYRTYAVDGNRDRKRDLWNPQDAIPSVANYFQRNGWVRGGGVAVPAYVSGNSYARLADTTPKKPSHSLGELLSNGVRPQTSINSAKLSLLKLEGSTANEYWVGGENFYVITRYNASIKYAMAVHQLAQAIRQRKFGY